MKLLLFISAIVFVQYVAGQTVGEVAPGSEAPSRVVLKEKYLNLRGRAVTKSAKDISSAEQESLDAVVDELNEYDGDTYEAHFLNYVNQGYAKDDFQSLEKAMLRANGRSELMELYPYFIGHYEIEGNDTEKKKYLYKLSNTELASKLPIDFNKNVLNSVSKNGIIFTNGFDDTYGLWMVQEILGFRKDVKVLNLDLLENEDYRKKMFSKVGLKDAGDPSVSKSNFLQAVVKANKGKNIYLSLGIVKSALKNLKKDLYLTGLTFKYSSTKIDNVKESVTCYEQKFDLSKLENSSKKLAKIEVNYLPLFLTLAQYYQSNGNTTSYSKVKSMALTIAKRNGLEKNITTRFEKME